MAQIPWLEERKKVVEAGLKLLSEGLVAGTSGNISLKIKGERLIAITPHDRYYDELKPEDILIIDFEGEVISGGLVPSVESMLHIAIYKARPEIGAVIHTHSPFAMALAASEKEVPPILEEQIIYLGGELKVAPYAVSGSQELASTVPKYLGERNAILLSHHGAIAVGKDLKHALSICRVIENTALAFIISSLLGCVKEIEPKSQEILKTFFLSRR